MCMFDLSRFNDLKKYLVLPLLIAFVTVVLLVFGSSRFTVNSESKISPIDEGWSVFRGVEVQRDINLGDYFIGDSKQGETIIASNEITVENTGTTLMFLSKLNTVDVYLDDDLIYTYGREYLKTGSFVPKKYNIVTLDTKPGVHKLIMVYTFTENNSVKRFMPVFYGQKSDLIKTFYSHHRISIFIGSFLVMYSCIIFALWVYLLLTRKNDIEILVGAIFANLLGVYIFARNDIFCFIGNREMFFSMVEYTSFYLIPLGFSMLIYSIHSHNIQNKIRVIAAVNIIFPIVIWILHISNIVHLNHFLNFVGVLDIIEMFIILPSLIKNLVVYRRKHADSDISVGMDAEIYLFIGFIIMMVMSLIEIGTKPSVKVNESVYISHTGLFTTINFLELGMLFFIMCHFIYYFMNSVNHISANRIKGQLEGLAYTDALTGLMNRAALSEFYSALRGNYGIVSIDLDRLKYVNDNMGHMAGDRMLKAFANILKKSFKPAGIIARTGGDEFLVVFQSANELLCKKCIDEMNREMAEFNSSNDEFTLSASAGFAFNHEVKSGRYQDVFYLADQRMYKMKEAHHG